LGDNLWTIASLTLFSISFSSNFKGIGLSDIGLNLFISAGVDFGRGTMSLS